MYVLFDDHQGRSRHAARSGARDNSAGTGTNTAPARCRSFSSASAAALAAAAALALCVPASHSIAASGGHGIIALVNDEPITAYEVEQRGRLLALSANIGDYIKKNVKSRWEKLIKGPNINKEFKAYAIKRNPKSKEELQKIQQQFIREKQKSLMQQLQQEARSRAARGTEKQAIQELVEERLKLQEAKRNNVIASDDEIDRIISGIAGRNKMTADQFAKHLGVMPGAGGGEAGGFEAAAQGFVMRYRAFEEGDFHAVIAGRLQALDDGPVRVSDVGGPEEKVEAEFHRFTQAPDLPDAMMASQTLLVSRASRKVGEVGVWCLSPSRKSAAWWVKECS